VEEDVIVSSSIEAGDTVEVVEVCPCGETEYLLGVYTVVLHTTERRLTSTSCGRVLMYTRNALVTMCGWTGYYPVRWLRKVPPLNELEEIHTTHDEPVLV
jgi:hypothetical protein